MLPCAARIAAESGLPRRRKRFMIFSSTKGSVTSSAILKSNQSDRRRASARSSGVSPINGGVA